jgi:cytochrome c peroxidase
MDALKCLTATTILNAPAARLTRVGLMSVVFLVWPAVGRAQPGPSHAEDPALSKRLKRINQDQLLKGDYPLRQILENGRHLFSTPFTKNEGYGEGGRSDGHGGVEMGPRESSFVKNLELLKQDLKSSLSLDDLRKAINFPPPVIDKDTGKIIYSYVRLNGLDSQSCFECHNSIGSERLPDTRSYALTRKQSTVGGPAGFASSAFINPNLPRTIFMFVRNPPHVFGTGYAQELAEEMTQDLLHLQTEAVRDALMSPGQKKVRQLQTKGVSFGVFGIVYDGDANNKPSLPEAIRAILESPGKDVLGFKVDTTQVQGVSPDLVVRPFQWKGIASNERNFVRDALQFHFGMEAREKNMDFGKSSEDHDTDKDGICDELSIGDVSSLTIFTMTIRVPIEAQPLSKPEREAVARGRRIFEGKEEFTAQVSCARCHLPALQLNDSTVVVRDPLEEIKEHGDVEIVGHRSGLTSQVRSSLELPAVRRYLALKPAGLGNGVEAIQKARSLDEQAYFDSEDRRKGGYAFDLTTLQPANADPKADSEHADPLSETQPRLPADGKTISVPLFSDLRRHKMGKLLSEQAGFQQQPDSQSIPGVPEDEFLTRPLWGVGDTGPWLHDGRAQSLREAILLHSSEGSEANDVIDAFKKLTEDDQHAIVAFLLTLRLPLDPRYGFDDYR